MLFVRRKQPSFLIQSRARFAPQFVEMKFDSFFRLFDRALQRGIETLNLFPQFVQHLTHFFLVLLEILCQRSGYGLLFHFVPQVLRTRPHILDGQLILPQKFAGLRVNQGETCARQHHRHTPQKMLVHHF